MNPPLYVITRTAGRRRAFERCRRSVFQQTYSPLLHVVTFEEEHPPEWLEADILVPVAAGPRVGKRSAPYNRFIGEARKALPDETGWYMVLDDDDEFLEETAAEQIMSMRGLGRVILWRVRLKNRTLPPTHLVGKKPVKAQICSCAYAAPVAEKKAGSWLPRRGGDFHGIRTLYEKLGGVWIDAVLTGLQGARGKGRRGQDG